MEKKPTPAPTPAPTHSTNLTDSPATTTAKAPALNPQASSLKDMVSPVQALAQNTTNVSLKDYNDTDPKHDPSNVSDAWIKSTAEYTELMQTYYLIPTTDPSQLYTPDEILLACRLMLRAMREGRTVTVAANGKEFLDQARMQRGVTTQAESLENKLSWNNQSVGLQNTEFGKWLLGGGPEPDPATGIMNCWELVMYSAYKAGFATLAGLKKLYSDFNTGLNTDVTKGIADFENALRSGKEQVYDPSKPADSPKPLRGDIVIFNNLGAHVAVATGNYTSAGVEIMSLWTQNSKKVYKTTVEELLKSTSGPVRFYSPKWQ